MIVREKFSGFERELWLAMPESLRKVKRVGVVSGIWLRRRGVAWARRRTPVERFRYLVLCGWLRRSCSLHGNLA